MTDRQKFQLVDANITPTEGGCGCGGHGHGEKGHGGHGGHGHGHGGHGNGHGHGHGGRPQEMAEPIASTACGCGGGGRAEDSAHPGSAAVIRVPGADELVIHSIPRVVRHAVLFAAVDALPVGENLQICAPHQPEPLFAHLQDSEQHYRVETLEVGPVDWRYRITRLA
ncbi:hemerythrin HHE cation-binding protein [Schaalia meyeri]|uniref:DUF2249 domain-containing protein n=1 Tax=Schaalia meyeri TaxID=52773 RepID=UPI00068095E6|nr:DUF2249 domain-containing protein [Schaalia meyeri]AKU65688.1 hemerythrin HHE cation-binding protein [Schaalia meyeri]